MGSYLEVRDISKTFYGVYALKDITFGIEKGTVHAIMGENGAGKSTLMKILGGNYIADTGAVYINGEKQKISSVFDAAKCGISVIYQEFNLLPDLTVAENIFISNYPAKTFLGIIDKKKRSEDAKKLLDMLNIDVHPDELVKNLSVSQKQMVEIAKALSRDSEIIIMDEPTAPLNHTEVEKLEEIVAMLKGQGKTILYISHRLKEIFDMCDTVTVLRNGRYVDTVPVSSVTENDLIRMMVGHEIEDESSRETYVQDEVVLEVQNLTVKGAFEDISFKLHKGEILCLAGFVGCGREEVVDTIYGLIRPDSGRVLIEGKEVKIRNPLDAVRYGINYITDDRKDAGIFPLMSVRQNTTIMSIRNLKKKAGFYIDPKSEMEELGKMTDYMAIKYDHEGQKISYLSGGNQQKVLLSRDLLLDTKVFIMREPTRGIDVGAKEEIYKLLYQLASQGLGILAIFSDMNELIKVSDRVIAIWDGRTSGEISRAEFTKGAILSMSAGVKTETDDSVSGAKEAAQ